MELHAIITGASGGIGSAVAKELASEGYHLTLLGNHSVKALEQCAMDCQKYGSRTLCLSGNLEQPSVVNELIEQSVSRYKNIDLLVNCAGISHIGLITDVTDRDWQQIINTNLSSIFYTCRSAVPHMVHQKRGRILNLSSVWGNVGASCEVAYSASKGGINALTKALARELAPSGIAVNALACGMIDTPMNSCFSENEISDICEEIPAGRMGSPKEVAKMVSLLANAPVYLTGQVITIDGGWT